MANKEERRLHLRCMAYPAKNDGKSGFYAVCLDLSVYTWRPTLEEAKKSLLSAIRGYLNTVSELGLDDVEDWKKALYRPMPFWPFQFKYYLVRIARRFLALLPSSSQPSQLFYQSISVCNI